MSKEYYKGTAGENPRGLPQVCCNEDDFHVLTQESWRALLRSNRPTPHLFEGRQGPVRLRRTTRATLAREKLTVERLLHELNEHVFFFFFTKGEDDDVTVTPAKPSRELAINMLARPDSGLPVLHTLVRHPVFVGEGRLHISGYDETSRIYVDLPNDLVDIDVEEAPADSDVKIALLGLRDLFRDFPLTGPVAFAHLLALLLGVFVRDMIKGSTPLFVIAKPTPGTGATLLVECIRLITSAMVALINEPRSDDEWGRTIFAALRGDPEIVVIDNLARPLQAPALAAAITATSLSGRVMGTSDTSTVEPSCGWAVTANNPTFSVEILRRGVWIELDARSERPELRRQFKHQRIKEYIFENRAWLLSLCVTLVQKWIAADKPMGKRILGGFEEWSETMGGILEANGISGFLEDADTRREEADAEAPFRAFIESWARNLGTAPVFANQLVQVAADLDLGGEDEHGRTIRLGKLLRRHRNRQFGSFVIRALGPKSGSQQWRLEEVSENEVKGPQS